MEWIDVKDRLPEIDEDVIVLTELVNDKIIEGALCPSFAHRVNTNICRRNYDGWDIPGVKYWIPYPEFPEK